MFQFGRFPTYTYVFSIRLSGIPLIEFPHSDICGSKRICRSPQLFAAYRVLLRLPMPRHSPCALSSLNLHELRKSFYVWSVLLAYCSCFTTLTFGLTFFVILFVICANIFHTCFSICFYSICFIQFSKYNLEDFSSLVGSSGLEPPTLRLSGARSSLLSYEPILIGVSSSCPLVEMKRFELLTPCLQGRCSPNWATPPEGI